MISTFSYSEDPERVVKDVEGMSGGPVFATRKTDQGRKYSVIGVQSAWYPSERIIAACPFSSLGLALEEVLRKTRDELARQVQHDSRQSPE